jgi:hypothetical protein
MNINIKLQYLRGQWSKEIDGLRGSVENTKTFQFIETEVEALLEKLAFVHRQNIELANSVVKTSAVETSAIETSAIETSAIETSAIETSAIETSAIETSAIETSAIETSAIETSAVETSAVKVPVPLSRKKNN